MSETFDEPQAYDLIAIGGGPAAESATELASFFGHRSLIIERNRPGERSPRRVGYRPRPCGKQPSTSPDFGIETFTVCTCMRRPRLPWRRSESAPGQYRSRFSD